MSVISFITNIKLIFWELNKTLLTSNNKEINNDEIKTFEEFDIELGKNQYYKKITNVQTNYNNNFPLYDLEIGNKSIIYE